MEFKGTKGKWEITKHQLSEEISINSGLFNIANVFSYDVLCGSNDIEEANANALLISKAREMLDFLQELSNAPKDLNAVYWIEKAKQLIKEATEINEPQNGTSITRQIY